MSIADACLHSSAAVDWQHFCLTHAQQLYLLFINKVVDCGKTLLILILTLTFPAAQQSV